MTRLGFASRFNPLTYDSILSTYLIYSVRHPFGAQIVIVMPINGVPFTVGLQAGVNKGTALPALGLWSRLRCQRLSCPLPPSLPIQPCTRNCVWPGPTTSTCTTIGYPRPNAQQVGANPASEALRSQSRTSYLSKWLGTFLLGFLIDRQSPRSLCTSRARPLSPRRRPGSLEALTTALPLILVNSITSTYR